MRLRIRPAALVGLACLLHVPALAAQAIGFESFKWYIGGQAGVTLFETPSQTRGGIFTAGGNLLVTGQRTGLLITVEEGIKTNQKTSYNDPTAPGGVRSVLFNDIRKYSFTLVAFPLKSAVQPYVGAGWGILQTVKEYPVGFFGTPGASDSASAVADDLGSHGFGTLVGGVQFRASSFVLFGQYQITTSPGSGKLFVGPTHAFMGGMRVSLGGAREDVGGGGYGGN
jgi:hypothetical protein